MAPSKAGEFRDHSGEEEKQNIFQPSREKFGEDVNKYPKFGQKPVFETSAFHGRESAPNRYVSPDTNTMNDFEIVRELPKMEQRSNVYANTRKSLPMRPETTKNLDCQPEAWLDNVLEDSPFN